MELPLEWAIKREVCNDTVCRNGGTCQVKVKTTTSATEQLNSLQSRFVAATTAEEKQRAAAELTALAPQLSLPASLAHVHLDDGRELGIYPLSLPLMIKLLFRQRPPTLTDLATTGVVPGWTEREMYLQTSIVAGNGATFDVSNQFEHSLVLLDEQEAIAGFLIIYLGEEDSYGRVMVIHPNYRQKNLATLLFYAQATYAERQGRPLITARVRVENKAIQRFLLRIGFELSAADERGYRFVRATTADVKALSYAHLGNMVIHGL